MDWLYRMSTKKIGKFRIPGLMNYILALMAGAYIAQYVFVDANILGFLSFSRALILQGQVWRLLTWIIVPPVGTSLVSLIFFLYFYYLVGSSLENEWGSFIFTFYYVVGVVCTIIAGFITGGVVNTYLNLSLYFAFAILYPNTQIYLFFLIPIKMKYLALANAVFYVITIIQSLVSGQWVVFGALIASLVNLAIFFGKDFFNNIKNSFKYRKTRRQFRSENNRSRWQSGNPR